MRYLSILLLLSVFGAYSCNKDSDMEKIEQYLADNGLTAQSTPEGVYYIITKEGSGGNPTVTSNVTVRYKGYLLNGDVFDQTFGNETTSFSLQSVIEGWQIAVPLLKKGGKGTFFIPSNLGYGSRSIAGIPGDSVLIFEIELVDFN